MPDTDRRHRRHSEIERRVDSESTRRRHVRDRAMRLRNYRAYLVKNGWSKEDMEVELQKFSAAGCPKGRRGTQYTPVHTSDGSVDIFNEARRSGQPLPADNLEAPTEEKIAEIAISPEQEAVIRAGLMVTDRDLYVRSIGQSEGFTPYGWQLDVLHSRSKRKCILGARQGGKSTIVACIPCHTAKYYPGSLSLIFAPTQGQSLDDMAKIKEFMSWDPSYPRKVRDSTDLVELVNGSRIQVVTASDQASRGKSHPRCIVIDEASRVEDIVYMSAIRPMLNSNPDCEMVLISTPNGKEGFFARAATDPRESFWERFVVVSPFIPDETGYELLDIRRTTGSKGGTLFSERAEAAKALGCAGFYISPRSDHYEEQRENLVSMGPLLYMQEFGCQFVERQNAVFTYSQIDSLKDCGGMDNPLFPASYPIDADGYEEVR